MEYLLLLVIQSRLGCCLSRLLVLRLVVPRHPAITRTLVYRTSPASFFRFSIVVLGKHGAGERVAQYCLDCAGQIRLNIRIDGLSHSVASHPSAIDSECRIQPLGGGVADGI